MRSPSIRTRLLGLLLGLAAIAIVVAAVSFGEADSTLASVQSLADRRNILQANAAQLSDALHEQEANFLEYELAGGAQFLEQYRRSIEVERSLDAAERFAGEATSELPDAFAALRAAAENWRHTVVEPEIDRILRGVPRDPDMIAKNEIEFDLARAALDRLHDALGLEDAVAQEHIAELATFRLGVLVGGIALLLVAALMATMLVGRWVSNPLLRLVASARRIQAGDEAPFEYHRNDEIGQLGAALEEMRIGLLEERASTAAEGELAGTINSFTELTAFIEEETAISGATIAALDELAHPSDAALHVSNRSQDRALPQASLGEGTSEVISLHQLSACPGVRRGSLYVTADLSGRLSVRCPVYPGTTGTLACVPLMALGETVGVAHLHWDSVDALALALRGPITRVAEHAALSIANRRLVMALQGQASTDARTGLPNSRAFDEALTRELATRSPGDRTAVLLLDIDNFKLFNDRHGHPAGDQALRAFAEILGSCVRERDVAARYGGEEFAVLLRGQDSSAGLVVAERIRERTEQAIIALAPGLADRITVSIGLATAPENGMERMELLAAADRALYRAKQDGRNRVAISGENPDAELTPAI